MSDKTTKEKSPPFVIYLPVLVILFILFQNGKDEQDTSQPSVESLPKSSSPQVENENPQKKSFEQLKKIGEETYESPAGLIYTTGSQDGHRIDHIMTHAVDEPEKPVHGVFDGDREQILALIDEVWQVAQERGPPDVEIQENSGRTVITVDLHRKIGYVGGESGKRKGHPACTKARLVLQGKKVITAYPVL